MLTSNGLRLASGVRKCSILGLSIAASLSPAVSRARGGRCRHRQTVTSKPSPLNRRRAFGELAGRREAAELGAAIAPGADAEAERALGAETLRERVLQYLRLVAVGDEDEAGRTPGALADAGKSLAAQPVERGGDTRAGIAPALH